MKIQHPGLRVLAEGCVLGALHKFNAKGVRIANHPVWLDGKEMEWLSIVDKSGSIRVFQHYPVAKVIGDFTPREVRALAGRRKSKMTSAAIRGHIRNETRRRA